MDLYGVIGKSEMKNLLADPQDADLIAIPCKPGNEVITAGTVMVRGEEDGLYSPAKKTDIVATNSLVVLKEDVDTGAGPIEAETTAEDAAAYRKGRFVDGAVVASDGPLDASHKLVLRQQGIVFDEKESTKTFDNKTSGE